MTKNKKNILTPLILAPLFGLLVGCGDGIKDNDIPQILFQDKANSEQNGHVIPTVDNETQVQTALTEIQKELTFASPDNWELGNYDRRLRGAFFVNKAQAEVHLVTKSGIEKTFPALMGRNKGDTLQDDLSVFKQGITPATGGYTAVVMFDPELDPKKYHKQLVILYAPFRDVNGKLETLAFHTTLNPKTDNVNVNDGDPTNNRVSNGCIRLDPHNFDQMLKFALGNEYEKFMAEIEDPEYKGPYMRSTEIMINVLPENDLSAKNTLKKIGMSDWKNRYPEHNF